MKPQLAVIKEVCAGPSAFQTEARLFVVMLFLKGLKPHYLTCFKSLRMTQGQLSTGTHACYV